MMKKKLFLTLGFIMVILVSVIIIDKVSTTSDPMTDLLKANIEAFAGIDPTQPPDGGGGPYMIPCALEDNSICLYMCYYFDTDLKPVYKICEVHQATNYEGVD